MDVSFANEHASSTYYRQPLVTHARHPDRERPGPMSAWRALILAAAVPFVATGAAHAQWVDFVDHTATRMMTAPVAIDDPLEKDIAVGDLNRDGWVDAVIVRKARFNDPAPATDILLMNESGVLVNRTAELAPGFLARPTVARDVFIVDVDGDLWDDVVIANTFEQQPALFRNLGEDAEGNWLGLADESFRLPILSLGGPLNFCALWAADLTGDGAPEIYFSNYLGPMGAGEQDFTFDVLLINDGDGFFTDETAARLSGLQGDFSAVAFGTTVELKDVDLDGDNDIIKISTLFDVPPWNEFGVFILFNDGAGVFSHLPFQSIAPQNDPYMYTLGDLNGDGMLDIYFVTDTLDRYQHTVGITQNGPIDYAPAATVVSPRLDSFGGNVKMADIDGDGDLDVGVASVDTDLGTCTGNGSTEFTLLRNEEVASGTLTDLFGEVTLAWHLGTFDFDFIDVDNDGKLDLLFGTCDGYRLFRQIEATCFLSSAPQPERIPSQSGELVVATKNRFLSFSAGDVDRNQAVRILPVNLPAPHDRFNDQPMWLGPPRRVSEIPSLTDDTPPNFLLAQLQCEPFFTNWEPFGTIHVAHEMIVPGGTYDVQVTDFNCSAGADTAFSAPLSLATSRWGDVGGPRVDGVMSAPDDRVDVAVDVVSLLDKFSNRPGAPGKTRADVEPAILDFTINITDVTRVLDAFRGRSYPFAPSSEPCPTG